jgi:hypothetical protein
MLATITVNSALHLHNAYEANMQPLMLAFDDAPGTVPGGLGKWPTRQVSSSSSSSTGSTKRQPLVSASSFLLLALLPRGFRVQHVTGLCFPPCCRLGHGTESSELFPRIVQALAGSRVAQVAAGGAHTAVATGK